MAVPDQVRYFRPTGSVNLGAMQQACRDFEFPAESYSRGFFSFCGIEEISEGFSGIGKFAVGAEVPILDFYEHGAQDPLVQPREASNLVLSISMLRNKAQGKIWQFGVSATPNFWPFPHYRLKARVLFALQHRYRRRICKGWRNKQWHGRLMAFVELLSGDEATIRLPVADDQFIKLDATPMVFTSPVTTVLPNILEDEDEEPDDDTFGSPLPDDEE
jgi:hypothetical protein